ncbi:MAG TPA: DUF1385 domain-containing protein [Candidatus Aquicultor sp.]
MSDIKVGGQAFGDGVLMRTKKYWALVREDGSTEFGSTHSWLDHHPRWNIFFIRSIISFFEMIKFGVKTYQKNPAGTNRRIILWLGIYLAITLPISMAATAWLPRSIFINAGFQFFYLLLALWTMSRGMTNKIWTYHGAEHKAVNAHEQGKDLNDPAAIQSCSRIHPRCGTNLVFVILVLMALYLPYPDAKVNALYSGAYIVSSMAMSLELFRQLTRFPNFILTKMVLFGGRMLQKFMTTREPDNDQVIIASKALQLVLALELLGDKHEIVSPQQA